MGDCINGCVQQSTLCLSRDILLVLCDRLQSLHLPPRHRTVSGDKCSNVAKFDQEHYRGASPAKAVADHTDGSENRVLPAERYILYRWALELMDPLII